MLLALSIMTVGSVMPSVSMFRPTATLSQSMSNAVNCLANMVKNQISNGTLVYKPETKSWWINDKTQVADAYVLNALTPQQKRAAEQEAIACSVWLKKFMIEDVEAVTVSSSMNSNQNFSFEANSNSNTTPNNFWAKVFYPLVGLITGTATVNAIDSMNSSTNVAQELVPVREFSKNDVVGQTISTNVASFASKQTVSFADEVRALALSTGTKLQTFGSSACKNTLGKELGYFKHDGKVATTAAVAAVAGISYTTYKAYKNGSFSKLNPFRKAAVVAQEAPIIEKVVAPVVTPVVTPVVKHKRQFNTPKIWNAKTRTYVVA